VSKRRARLREGIRPEELRGLTCAQYIRDSTDHQRDGCGPDMQRTANRRFVERFGLVDSGLEFVEFTSAFQGVQAELEKAIGAMEQGRFRVLLVGWEHRLTRSLERAAQIERSIGQAGGFIAYADSNKIAGADWVADTMHHFTNEMYSRNLSRLVSAGLAEKFEAGQPNGHPPLGTKHVYIRRDGSTTEHAEVHTRALRVIDEERLPTLRSLLERYAANGSYRKTAECLNAHGHTTRRGQPFRTSSIQEIISNPFYGPEEIIRYHPGYEDERVVPTSADRRIFPSDIHELWLEADRKRGSRANQAEQTGTKHIYPLHSVLRCAYCGGLHFHGQSRGSQRLTRHVNPKPECPRPWNVPSVALEDQVIELLTKVDLPRNWRSQIQLLIATPVNDGEADRRRLDREFEQLRKQHMWGFIGDDEMQTQGERIKRALADFAPPPAVEAYAAPVQLLRSVGQIVKSATKHNSEQGRALFRRFCEAAFTRIEIEGRQVKSVEPRERYREIFAVGLQSSVVRCAVKRTRTSTPVMGTAS
jgi:DNA invertase Pin-like site-specific DNA recombinase